MHQLPLPLRRASAAAVFALASAAAAPASAAIAPGIALFGTSAPFSGQGELFLNVFDSAAQVSYSLDLGVLQNDFFTLAQRDTGYQRFWEVSDANWQTFLTFVSVPNLRWSVMAIDQAGPLAPGGQRWFMTIRQGDEGGLIDASRIDPTTTTTPGRLENLLFTNAISGAQAGTFFNEVNSTGTHGQQSVAPNYAVNGSSFNFDADPFNAYVSDTSVGLSTTLNGASSGLFQTDNAVGDSSWFYYLTRSGPDQLETVLVDEFDNLSHDGYFGFVYVDPALYPTSPFVGRYLLSYTIAAAGTPQAVREFGARIGRTEWSLYTQIVALPSAGPLVEAAAPGALALPAVSAVPEPRSLLLFAAGAAALAFAARRRSGR
jgi:hypothetical protein